MNKDRALIKAIKNTEIPQLSPKFNHRMMSRVYETATLQKKRSVLLSYSLISFVSLALIALAGYLLRNYLSFSFSIDFLSGVISPQSKTIFTFSIYIGSLVLILMFLDNYFRTLREKHLKKSRE